MLNNKVWGKRFGSIDDLVEEVERMFYENDSETLERVSRSLLTRYNQVPQNLRRSDFRVGHTATRKRQRDGTFATSVEVDQWASKAALN